MSETSCDCPNPPGGKVTCGPGQIAICRVMNGEVRSFCIDPPRGFKDLSFFNALKFGKFIFETLHQVTEEKRWQKTGAPLAEALDILKAGHYENRAGGLAIQIQLPRQFYAEANDEELDEVEA